LTSKPQRPARSGGAFFMGDVAQNRLIGTGDSCWN
jgi:hypothetical protein